MVVGRDLGRVRDVGRQEVQLIKIKQIHPWREKKKPRLLDTLGDGSKVHEQLPRLAVSWWMCGSRSW